MKSSNEVIFFVLGVAIGVIATVLTSPYSGPEARNYLLDRIDEGREGAGEALERGKEFVGRQASAIGDVFRGRGNHPERL